MSSVVNNGATNSATPPFIQNISAGGTPANGYVAEDDVTAYVAENGTTFYVQEV